MITIAEHRKIDSDLLKEIDQIALRKRLNYDYDTKGFDPSLVNLLRYKAYPNPDNPNNGFYSYFIIGAEWLDAAQTESIVVVPKVKDVDFIEMFMTCLQDNETADKFSLIYEIDFDSKPIKSKSLSSVLSPLLIIQFLMVVKQISNQGLRKDYIRRTEDLTKIKGRINMRATESLAMKGHRERANCTYEEYSVDTPENRYLKRALQISKDIISLMDDHHSYPQLMAMCNHCLSAFEKVSDDHSPKPITVKGNKLYREYAIAHRMAKMIMRRQDISIDSSHRVDYDIVPVFRIDMALLFEHYTLALLRKAFGQSSVLYQTSGYHGRFYPDFVISNNELKVIVDAKYVDSDNSVVSKSEYIKQLSAYCRDTAILQKMGYDTSNVESIPIVPCILAHPSISARKFSKEALFSHPVRHTLKFYTLPIRIPTIKVN